MMREYKRPEEMMPSAAFLPEGASFLTGGMHGSLIRRNTTTGEKICRITIIIPVGTIGLDGEGTTILVKAPRNKLKTPDSHTGDVIKSCEGQKHPIDETGILPSKQYILSGDNKGNVKLRHTAKGKVIRERYGHKVEVSTVAFSPGEKYFLTGIMASLSKEKECSILRGNGSSPFRRTRQSGSQRSRQEQG
jgi:WD40 repeat protein